MTVAATKPTAKKPLHAEISQNQSDWLRVDAATPDAAGWVKDHLPEFTGDILAKKRIYETDSSKSPVSFGIPVSPIFDIEEVCAWFNENYPGK